MRWHTCRMSPGTGQIEYLGDLGKHKYRYDSVKAAEERWSDYRTERVGMGRGIPSVSVKPENDAFVRQLLARQRA